jgi:hypothetical protein
MIEASRPGMLHDKLGAGFHDLPQPRNLVIREAPMPSQVWLDAWQDAVLKHSAASGCSMSTRTRSSDISEWTNSASLGVRNGYDIVSPIVVA